MTSQQPVRPTDQVAEDQVRPIPTDEPTLLERLICAQFRRGIPVPLSPPEQARLLTMSLEQRCDYVAKLTVWTARAIERRITETNHSRPEGK